jgi:hypothetical protein
LVFIFHLKTAAKISNFSHSSEPNKDVVWFQVAMHNILLMSIGESFDNIETNS